MSEIAEDVRRAAMRAADTYRAATGDNAFNLNFDGTMELLSMAILDERERAAKAAEQRGKELREMAVGSDIANTIREPSP